jgi:hypothetical protein
MVTRVTVSAEEAAAITSKPVDQRLPGTGNAEPDLSQVSVRQGSGHRVVLQGGQITHAPMGVVRATASVRDPIMCTVDGLETRREVAKNLGLIPDDERRPQ